MFWIFFLIMVIFPFKAMSFNVEIIVDGKKYDSFKDYKVNQNAKIDTTMDINKVNIEEHHKMKTIVISKGSKQDQAGTQKLRMLSVNPPDGSVVLHKPQSWKNSSPLLVRLIKSENLEAAIERAVSQTPSVKAIVSDSRALKVLGLTPENMSEVESAY